MLRNSDRIDFGIRESFQLTFTLEPGEIHRILDQITTGAHATPEAIKSPGQAALA